MKVKLIKELNPEELSRFRLSKLYQLTRRNFQYVESYIVYNKEYFGVLYQDFSLIVFDQNDYYLSVPIFINSDSLNFFNTPIRIIEQKADNSIIRFAYQNLFEKIEKLGKDLNIKRIEFYFNPYFVSNYFEGNIKSEVEHWAYIDLSLSIQEIKINIRKSYKSLINWGYKNLRIEIVDSKNPDKTKFYDFKDLHIKVSGRKTRSDLTWDLQYKSILQKEAFLVLGFFDDVLVSGAFILHSNEQAYYGVAVNNRELMAENLPIGHAVLMSAILQTKKMGLKKFILGNIDFINDDKINNINKYKRGFSITVDAQIKYSVSL